MGETSGSKKRPPDEDDSAPHHDHVSPRRCTLHVYDMNTGGERQAGRQAGSALELLQ